MAELHRNSTARYALEELWRDRLQIALRQYQTAKETTRTVQALHAEGLTPPPDGAFAFTQALKAESAALKNYRRLLLIFTTW